MVLLDCCYFGFGMCDFMEFFGFKLCYFDFLWGVIEFELIGFEGMVYGEICGDGFVVNSSCWLFDSYYKGYYSVYKDD